MHEDVVDEIGQSWRFERRRCRGVVGMSQRYF